jgi:hypothetical protein
VEVVVEGVKKCPEAMEVEAFLGGYLECSRPRP